MTSNNLNISSQAKSESRNPFAKKTAGAAAIGSPSQSGIVFDSIKSNSDKASSTSKELSGFGQRKIVLNNSERMKKKEKENRSVNCNDQLKGFQLYFVENKSSFSDEEAALTQWKSLDKSQKESYKTARIPRPEAEQGKRKRSNSGDEESKKIKTSQKLSGFAFTD